MVESDEHMNKLNLGSKGKNNYVCDLFAHSAFKIKFILQKNQVNARNFDDERKDEAELNFILEFNHFEFKTKILETICLSLDCFKLHLIL